MRLGRGPLALLGCVLACATLEVREPEEKIPIAGDDDDDDVATSPTSPPTPIPTSEPSDILYQSDFEANDGMLVMSGNGTWEWGVPEGSPPNGGAHGGMRVWETNLSGPYDEDESSCLVLAIAIPPEGAIWQSWVRHDVEQGFDRLRIRSCAAGGTACTNLLTSSAENRPWKLESFDLSPWSGTTRELRWCLEADGSFEESGIAVDDVLVVRP